MENEATPKKHRGAHQKRPPMKIAETPKTQRGLSQRPPIKKRGNPKNAKGLITKTSDGKRGNPKNAKGLTKKALRGKKKQSKNLQQIHTLTEANSANLTVEGEGDAFQFRPQITSRMKATN
jgi:hypothetical protein